MNIQNILNNEGIFSNKECSICYNKFINIRNYQEFLDQITPRYELSTDNQVAFVNETIGLCYDNKFKCLTCKNIVCRKCIMNMPDNEAERELRSARNNYAMFNNGYTYNVYEAQPTMDETGIITCPFCRTKDYREKYTKYKKWFWPEEILYDIKNLRNIEV